MFGFNAQAKRLDETKGRYDLGLILAACGLAALGVIMVASSSIAIADGQHVGPFYYLIRHLVFLSLGIALCIVMMRTELAWFERHAFSLLLFSIILLLLVFVPGLGMRINGARRWIRLGIVGFQSVEAVKLLFIVYIASYLVRHESSVQGKLFGVVKPIGVAIVLVALLLAQPDRQRRAIDWRVRRHGVARRRAHAQPGLSGDSRDARARVGGADAGLSSQAANVVSQSLGTSVR